MKIKLRSLLIVMALVAGVHQAAAQDAAFTMYVANFQGYGGTGTRNFTIERFDSHGNAGVFATNSSISSPILSGPVGVALDSSGHVYVDCTQDGTWIEEFDPAGNNPAIFVNPTVGFPAGMVFDVFSNLYVANNNSIERYDPMGVGTVFATTGTAFLEGLAFDPNGNLWVSDEFNGLIEERNTNGTLAVFATPGHNPFGLAFDSATNLYVALYGNGTIVKYDLNTNQTLVANLGATALPVGLGFDPAGNLYVTESGLNRIVKIDPLQNVTAFATNGLNTPLFFAMGPAPPTLTAIQSDGVTILWPYPSTGWTLQQNSDLTTANWLTSGGVANDGTNNFITIHSPTGNLFFRLAQH